MPTECERSHTSLMEHQSSPQKQPQTESQLETPTREQGTTNDDNSTRDSTMSAMEGKDLNGEMSTSQTSTTSSNGHSSNNSNGSGKKTPIISPDPTAYVAKARVTRPTPPPPSYNPMQFVQIKPCNLYQTAQEQLKKAEEVKRIKEVKKEEPEDWQNNLDNWKSSRRKRVEHIIDRVVEVKKLELEDHDRSRKKSKTLSEMIEQRGERNGRGLNKLNSLTVYNEDETNDLSDLGIGTSSASGKSSQSEDYDNNSVLSDNPDIDKAIFESNHKPGGVTREYISSPGYDTSSSTAPGSSPDPCEYTYEGAIQDYKQRVSRATAAANYKFAPTNSGKSKETTPERLNSNHNGNNNNSGSVPDTYPTRRGSKIEDRLIGFEVTSPSDSAEGAEKNKVDVPKIDISKRKEIFESQFVNNEPKSVGSNGGGAAAVPRVTLRDRFAATGKSTDSNEPIDTTLKREVKRLSGDITSVRDRLQSLEQQQQQNSVNATGGGGTKMVDIPVPPLKDRLSSLQNAVTKEEVKKAPVALVDARQLEIMKNEEENAKKQIVQQTEKGEKTAGDAVDSKAATTTTTTPHSAGEMIRIEVDRDDSGIHTSDDIDAEEPHATNKMQKEQEQQLNAAIAALAMEEKQLEEAANAVNQIEAEFAELSSTASAALPNLLSATNEQPCEMEFSVSSTNKSLNPPSSNGSSNPSDSSSPHVVLVAKEPNAQEVVGMSAANADANAEHAASKLRRKPSNEMVHARNLLKMFKDTFHDDVELDVETSEKKDEVDKSNQNPKNEQAIGFAPLPITSPKSPSQTQAPIETQIFESSSTVTKPPQSPLNLTQKPPSPTPLQRGPGVASMIPRSVVNPIGKPPMSPKATRYAASKLPTQSPVNSPPPVRKSDNQFSINGRVEIFNSKNMSPNPAAKPPTPTLPPKKLQMPHLAATESTSTPLMTSNPTSPHMSAHTGEDIGLPKQQQQQQQQQHQTQMLATASPAISQAVPISNPTFADGKSMPMKPVNEPHETRLPITHAAAMHAQSNPHPQQQQQQQHPEVVTCAPPVTIVNPDELPKPNTVKALSSCFSQENNGKVTPPVPPPKPLPRSRIPQMPPSPTPAKRNLPTPPPKCTEPQTPTSPQLANVVDSDEEALKKLSLVSSISSVSTDSQGHGAGPFETTAVVHSPPQSPQTPVKAPPTPVLGLTPQRPTTLGQIPPRSDDPLKPNDAISPHVSKPSEMPPLVVCTPNESSLFKLASSPASPASPVTPLSDSAMNFCTDFLSSYSLPPDTYKPQPQRQISVDEKPCGKLDVGNLSPNKQTPATFFSEISTADIKHCDDPNKFAFNARPQRQVTIDEKVCCKVDVNDLPPDDQIPSTSYAEVDVDDIKRCDGVYSVAAARSPTKKTPPSSPTTPTTPKPKLTGSKPTSPIMEARAAHSKALIETCEKIIAEEREASSKMKSSLPASPLTTPQPQRKSRIPKPIQCCISAGSMSKADYEDVRPRSASEPATPNSEIDDSLLLARLHVVETQIKVTTTTPPASPKLSNKTQASGEKKKTKNIFEFIKKNFGYAEKDDGTTGASTAAVPLATTTATASGVEVSVAPPPPIDIVKVDQIITVENSKFYIPSIDNDTPPPLPKTPAPVNIEITKTITTDEILEDPSKEKALTQEINDLLDEEIDKLNATSEVVMAIEKEGGAGMKEN